MSVCCNVSDMNTRMDLLLFILLLLAIEISSSSCKTLSKSAFSFNVSSSTKKSLSTKKSPCVPPCGESNCRKGDSRPCKVSSKAVVVGLIASWISANELNPNLLRLFFLRMGVLCTSVMIIFSFIIMFSFSIIIFSFRLLWNKRPF